MDEKELQKQIALYYSKLPADVQEIFSKMEWLETLKQISLKYSLNDKQIQILGTETTLVLLGIIHLDEYEKKVMDELDLSKESSDKMLGEINESILKSVRPQLSLTFDKNIKDLAQEQDQVGEKLDARFDKVPEEIKKIIIESNYYETLYNIAKANKITTELMGILEGITTNVITGVIHGDKFEEKIKEKLVLSNEEARKISNEINDKILRPIREKMEKVYNRPQNTTYDIKPVEIKPVRDNGLNNATDNTEKQREPTSNGIKIIRPARNAFGTADAGGPKINAMELEDGKENIEIPAHNIGESVPEEKSILAQKLDSSVKNTTTETDHSLKNLPSSATQNKTINNKDPYREIPE